MNPKQFRSVAYASVDLCPSSYRLAEGSAVPGRLLAVSGGAGEFAVSLH